MPRAHRLHRTSAPRTTRSQLGRRAHQMRAQHDRRAVTDTTPEFHPFAFKPMIYSNYSGLSGTWHSIC